MTWANFQCRLESEDYLPPPSEDWHVTLAQWHRWWLLLCAHLNKLVYNFDIFVFNTCTPPSPLPVLGHGWGVGTYYGWWFVVWARLRWHQLTLADIQLNFFIISTICLNCVYIRAMKPGRKALYRIKNWGYPHHPIVRSTVNKKNYTTLKSMDVLCVPNK